jgi:hypothetical protein
MTTNPASSADTLSMSQQQMLLTVQNLQDMQKDLMNQFTSASNPDERKKIANEMDKNEAVRANLLLSIGTANVVSNQVVATKTDELQLKKTLLQLANDELNATRKAMEEIQQTRAEKERMIGINTYFGKRFSAQAGVMKIFIYMCIPVLFLAILANMGFLPNYIAGFLIIASIVIGLIYIYNAISDINRRDDMNFDEYRWEFDPSRVGTIHHPHRHNKKKKDSSDADCKCDVQGDKSAVKGTSHKTGKSATSVANTAAPASGLLGDLSKPTAITAAPLPAAPTDAPMPTSFGCTKCSDPGMFACTNLPQSNPLKGGGTIPANTPSLISNYMMNLYDLETPAYTLEGNNYWWRQTGGCIN